MVPASPGVVGYVSVDGSAGESASRLDGGVGTMHPEAAESKNIYDRYRHGQLKWSAQASEDLKMYNGVHWTRDQKTVLEERGQQPIAIQATYQLVQQAVGMLTANDPRFNAAARENSDALSADAVRHLLQWGWQTNEGRAKLKQTVLDYYVQGRGQLYIYIDPNKDYGKGEVCIQTMDPKDIYPDPSSTHPLWDDAKHVIVRRLLTKSQVSQLWPHFNFNGVRTESDFGYSTGDRFAHNDEIIFPEDINDWSIDKYEVLERYSKVKVRHWRIFNPHTGREDILDDEQYIDRLDDIAFILMERGVEQIVTQPDLVAETQQLFDTYGPVSHLVQPEAQPTPEGGLQEVPPQRVPGPEGSYPNSIPNTETTIVPTTVGQLVEQEILPTNPFLMDRIRVIASIGGKLLYEPFVLRTSYYPIINFPNSHNRNPYPISDVHRVRDLQDVINKTNSLILAHAANVTNMKVFVPHGAVSDVEEYEQQWSKAGTAFLTYDPEFGVPIFAQPQPLPNELYTNQDRAITMMERILGVFSVMQGDPSSAPQTFKGTMAIDEFGARRMKSKMDDIYVSLARAGKVWLELAQGLYTEEKVTRIIQPDGQIDEQVYNTMQFDDYGQFIKRINDVTVGNYDIIIQAGSTLPSDRWAKLETYQQMYVNGLVDQVAVLKNAEIPDAAGILERTGMIQQLQAQLGQAEEIIKNLKGDLQTSQREEMNARQKAELEKYKAGLKGVEGDFRKSAQVFDMTLQKEREKQQAIAQAIRQNAGSQFGS